jgi:hypothetical protein
MLFVNVLYINMSFVFTSVAFSGFHLNNDHGTWGAFILRRNR